jgi:hypothetical protein
MDEQSTIETIERALKHVCPHPRCVGREAALDLIRRLVPDPAGWIVKDDDGKMALYALVGRRVHVVRAECKARKEPPDEPETAGSDYRVWPIEKNADFECSAARVEQRDREPKTTITWKFRLDQARPPTVINFTSGPDDAEEQRQADQFGRALIAEISRPAPSA